VTRAGWRGAARLAVVVATLLPARAARAATPAAAPGGQRADGDGQDDDDDDDDDVVAPAMPRKEVGPLVKGVFADQRFVFCHDARYPLTRDEVAWCGLKPQDRAACPALEQACAGGVRAQLVSRRQPMEISLPDLPLPGRALLWLLLGGAFVAVVVMLVRQTLAQRAPRDTEVEVPVADDPAAAAAAAKARAVETDVARLLARAQAAADRGDYGAAITDAYAAVLRKLEGADVVRVEADRTNGDHLRDVGARRPELRADVAQVIADVEEVEFGGLPATPARFGGVKERVLRVVGAWLGPALVLLAAGATLAGCQPDRQHWDESPSGRAAVVAFLRSYGFDVHERFASLTKIDDAIGQIVIVPGTPIDEPAWKSLRAWVEAGGRLILAGVEPPADWGAAHLAPGNAHATAPLQVTPGWAGLLGPLTVVVPGARALAGAGPAPLASSSAGDDQQASATVVAGGGGPYIVAREYGEGGLLLLADDQLLTNAALLAGDNARFLSELLRMASARIDLAGELTGLAAETPLSAVQRGRLAPVLCQLALLAICFFVWRGARFGRAVDPANERRRSFSEHARAVGLRYARARGDRLALELYGAYAFERLRDRLHVGGARGLSATAEAVAVRTGRPLGEVMRILVEARETEGAAAPGAPAAPSEGGAGDLTTLRQLAALLAESHHRRTDGGG
jgi:hypothetical protein